ncbi:hypothetical protein [Synechococcus sp. MVIR-18-1]|uniref:hypothetical protein n=1 Tax=Synechococcus sp. MVIR-18-1 TaxID=1386941 RepID=UPI001645A9F3|nr:hypothetical protein [Synechococcus sp. MVIR-18-1]QNI76704.1 hypothetical protein SynMVIR181_01734 [Synechococcus sp. MVIR-18-1]
MTESDQAAFWTSRQRKAKENPAKGRVSRLLFGRVALFPLREEALLTNELCLRNLAEQVPTYQLLD